MKLLTARRSKQSILKEISPEYSLEGPMLKLQYFAHLMQRTDSFEKTLMPEKIEGRRRAGWQKMCGVGWHHRLNGHEFEQAPGGGGGQRSLECYSPWGCKESGMTGWLNRTATATLISFLYPYARICLTWGTLYFLFFLPGSTHGGPLYPSEFRKERLK